MAITIELTPSEAREVAPLLRSLHSGGLAPAYHYPGDGPTLRRRARQAGHGLRERRIGDVGGCARNPRRDGDRAIRFVVPGAGSRAVEREAREQGTWFTSAAAAAALVTGLRVVSRGPATFNRRTDLGHELLATVGLAQEGRSVRWPWLARISAG